MYFDGSYTLKGAGAGVVLTPPPPPGGGGGGGGGGGEEDLEWGFRLGGAPNPKGGGKWVCAPPPPPPPPRARARVKVMSSDTLFSLNF
jgi:hypothetical protein